MWACLLVIAVISVSATAQMYDYSKTIYGTNQVQVLKKSFKAKYPMKFDYEVTYPQKSGYVILLAAYQDQYMGKPANLTCMDYPIHHSFNHTLYYGVSGCQSTGSDNKMMRCTGSMWVSEPSGKSLYWVVANCNPTGLQGVVVKISDAAMTPEVVSASSVNAISTMSVLVVLATLFSV